MEPNRKLILEEARSIREGLWRIAQLAQEAAEALDSRIEEDDLDDKVEVRETLERVQALSLELSEELDVYQNKHSH